VRDVYIASRAKNDALKIVPIFWATLYVVLQLYFKRFNIVYLNFSVVIRRYSHGRKNYYANDCKTHITHYYAFLRMA